MNKYIPGMGNTGARLMIVGEAPTSDDSFTGRPFTGTNGRELDKIISEVGIKREELWLTNVFKSELYPSPRGKKRIPAFVKAKNLGIDIDASLAELQNEINSIKPNCILGLGSTALWALTGQNDIGSYRGSILQGMGRKSVFTYNPAHLLFNASDAEFIGYWNKVVIQFDFKRALAQSRFAEIIRPNRHLQVCKSSYELAQFLDRYKHHSKMSTDIEARGHCLPICMGIAFDKSHGMCVPLWNRDDISNIPDSDLAQCWILLAQALHEKEIIGQNFNYDRDKIRRLGFAIRKLYSDTMFKAFAINPELPKGLGFNTSIYTEEPFYKNEGMYEGSIQDLLIGCARDACVTYEVNENMDPDLDELNQRKFYENFILKLPELYLNIENQGFRQDIEERDRLLHKYVAWDEKLRYEMFKLTGEEVNINSPKQVWTLLFDVLKLPQRDGTGEEELTSLLNLQSFTDENKRRIVEVILENRRVRRSINSSIMVLPDFDGRIRTTYFPCLETGRTSTGMQEPPIRPLVDVVGANKKKDFKPLGTPFQVMTKHGDIGADVRGMYVIDSPDEVFIQADSSQAEARVVFLLADDEQALEDIDKHDYHALTASWFFGGTEFDYSKKVLGYESPIRFAGKTLRHAGHLGAGKRRAATELNTQARKYKIPIKIDEGTADRALKIFHQKQPSIQKVFHASIIEALKNGGRKLIAPIPYGIDAPIGGVRTFYERWGDELFRQAFSYIPQRAVTDNTKAAAIRIRDRIPGIKLVLESHDALLFCVRNTDANTQGKIIKEEMERPINFSACSVKRRKLIIPCELEIGVNYKDLSKFKFSELIEPRTAAGSLD